MHTYRIFLKNGTSFTINAGNIQFTTEGEVEVFNESGEKYKDIYIQALEVAAVISAELLSDVKDATTS